MEPVARNIIQNLLNRKLITNRQVVDGSIAILMGRQRNRFFAFKQLNGPSFFIKQAHEAEPGTTESIALEAGIYKAVSENSTFSDLRALMPHMRHYDPDTSTLTLELIRDAKDIGSASRDCSQIDPVFARNTGEIIARFHNLTTTDVRSLNLPFDEKPHWIFRLEENPSPLPSLRGRSVGSAELIDHIRSQSDLTSCLSRCGEAATEDRLIHGDFKWENFLITPENHLKLIDWERANIGDPAWDTGCGLAAVLIHQIMRPEAGQDVENHLTVPFVQDSMHEFWHGYISARGITQNQINDFRDHSTDMAAARMLVAAYEYCYAQDQLPDLAQRFVQMAQHLLHRNGRKALQQALASREKVAA